MLRFERGGTLNAQNQGAGLAHLRLGTARPLDFQRLRMGGDVGADDLGPAGDEFRRRETLTGETAGQKPLRHIPQWTAKRSGLVHVKPLCQIDKAMTLAAPRVRKKARPAKVVQKTAARKKTVRKRAAAKPPAPREPAPRAATLLAWYARHRRHLPWRARPSEPADPYRVWLSEIMLQQTTVKAVGPYFERFLARWPRLQDLASAPLEDVLKLWAGLGYYARARNLHVCARAIVERHGGAFPDTEDTLRTLPGIGAYTAAAIAAIAFGRKATPVDGNIERVIARLHAIETPLPAAKPLIHAHAQALTPARHAGDFAQAMMDLGASLCSPKRPACALCPWNDACAAHRRGDAETFPRKTPKANGALRRGAAYVAVRADGAILARVRPPAGLLGGMMEVPTTDWTHDFDERDARAHAPFKAAWQRVPGVVRHVFTHFPLELTVYRARAAAGARPPKDARWIAGEDIAGEAFPNVMRKAIAHALGG